MQTLTQNELESLKVGEIVEVLISKESGFTKEGWVPAVVIPSTYYGAVMFYSISKILNDKDSDSYNGHRLWVGRNRSDLVRRTTRTFAWSYRAKG